MECYTHSGAAAVGVCKCCGKAVCRACAVEVPMALACSTACAEEAGAVHEMNQRGKKIYGIGAGNGGKMASGFIIYALFAVFMFGMGIFNTVRNHSTDYFSFGMGMLMLVICGVIHRRTRELGLRC